MITHIPYPVADKLTVEALPDDLNRTSIRLMFPQSDLLVAIYDHFRRSAHGRNELSVRLNDRTANIILCCDDAWRTSWNDVPCHSTEIKKSFDALNQELPRGGIILQFMEHMGLIGPSPAPQPVATSVSNPIAISRVVLLK